MAFGANPVLKRIRQNNAMGASGWTQIGGYAPAANRVLIVSKLILTCQSTAALLTDVLIGATSGNNGDKIASQINLNPGEQYTETGLIVLAGEGIWVYNNTASSTNLMCQIFGEEVDAS